MISLNSILVAQPIALSLQESEANIFDRSSDFVKSLCELSTGVESLTPENLATTIPQATDATSDHSIMQAQAIEKIAEGVNNSFLQIRQYLRPLDVAIREAISDYYAPDSGIEAIHNAFYVTYVELEHPFYTSSLFPTATPSPSIDYNNYSLDMLSRYANKFPSLNVEKMGDLLSSTSDEFMAMFEMEEMTRDYNNFISGGYWTELFPVVNGKLKFDSPVMDVKCLVNLHILASRLNVSEDVIEGVTGMSLEDYRIFVHQLLNITIYALQRIRNTHQTLAQTDLPILKLEVGEYDKNGTFSGYMKVGLTDKAINAFDSSDISLSEALIGYTKAKKDANGTTLPPLMDDLKTYADVYRAYVKDVSLRLAEGAESRVRRIVEEKVNEFQKTHSELQTNFESMNDDLPYRRLCTAISEDINRFMGGYLNNCIRGNMSTYEYLAKPAIAIAVAKKLGMTFSAHILENSIVTSDMTLEQQRAKLAEATAEAIAALCLGKHL